MRISDLSSDVCSSDLYAAYISDLYSQCALMRGPLYSETRYRARGGRTGLTRRLICPLAAAGQRIDMFIAVQTFELDAETGTAPTYTFAEEFRPGDRKSGGKGKGGAERGDIGGRRRI